MTTVNVPASRLMRSRSPKCFADPLNNMKNALITETPFRAVAMMRAKASTGNSSTEP